MYQQANKISIIQQLWCLSYLVIHCALNRDLVGFKLVSVPLDSKKLINFNVRMQ
jgi:hypothetical protein